MKTMLILIVSLMLAGCAGVLLQIPPVTMPMLIAEKEDAPMSETSRFLHHRPFPFCTSQASAPSETFYDYVACETSPSDPVDQPGLTQAMAFWWNIESVELQPTGSITSGATVYGFLKTYGVPKSDDPDLTEMEFFGSMAGGASAPISSSTVVDPSGRVCCVNRSIFNAFWRWDTSGIGGPSTEQGEANFTLAFEDGEWRVYYAFSLRIDLSGSAVAYTSNPANAPGITQVATGTFVISGMTFDWVAQTDETVSDAFDLTSDETFFTYPAP